MGARSSYQLLSALPMYYSRTVQDWGNQYNRELFSREQAEALFEKLIEHTKSWETLPGSVGTISQTGVAEDSELELKFIDSIKTVARTNKWDFEKVPDADSYRYELRIMDGENDIKYYIIPQFALGGHYGVKHYTVADFQIICMSARINGNDFKEIDKLPMWAIFLDGYTYHAQAPNMRFYGDKEKRDGIRDSKTHRIFSWTMTWEDIQLFENDKEDSLGLNSITRLIEFLKNPQMGYIRETAFGCIADAENFMGHGGALYQGEITIDESCYDELTDFSTDEKVAEEIDKGISYNWNLQQIYPDIDKDEWIGFWRRYNLLQFFSNTTKVEPVIDADMVSVDRDEIKMYYPGLEHIVDILLDHKIPFGTDGDVDLTDSDGIVLASAGMIIRDLKIVIDPADDNSESIFEAAGFKIFTAENFDINEITNI
jgi:DEAD/DEAH box helicase domain-containing protein